MKTKSGFAGFPPECVKFFTELKENNSKEWFAAHKQDYEKFVMAPVRDFVYEMGLVLESISPGIVADPRVDKSIFRIFRDTRFSRDKSPYKTHLGVFFWEGDRPKMECSGFYFHLEPPVLMTATGMHCFPKTILGPYRDFVVDPKHGPALAEAIKQVTGKGDYVVGGVHYKKTPRGYDANHDNAALLLHDGLYAFSEAEIPDELYSAAILDYVFARFKDMAPLHRQLVEMTRKASREVKTG